MHVLWLKIRVAMEVDGALDAHLRAQAALALLHLSEEHILACGSLDEFVEGVRAIASAGDGSLNPANAAITPETFA